LPGIHRLSKKDIERAKPGQRLGDGGGLFMHVRDKGAKYWSIQTTIKAPVGRGKRVELGLGRYPDVNLRRARELALAAREQARNGIDPRDERRLAYRLTFAQVCDLAFEARKAELKGDGTAGRWMSPLVTHVLPKLGNRPVDAVHQNDIVDVLKPLWHTKASTAQKAMGRIAIVLKHAAAMDLDVDLQATDKARALLGKSRHVPQNIPSMPWQEVPAFFQSLGGTNVELALRLLILTGARTDSVLFAHVGQIEGNVWTVPAEHMKGQVGKTTDFRVPLSSAAVEVIKQASPRSGYLFPGPRKDQLSNMALSTYMKRAGFQARPHGFRASLRTWLAEATAAPHEVAETMLAHSSGSKVVDAYRRTDYLEQRAALLERWAGHIKGGAGEAVKLAG
jgi:integrase